MALHAYAARKVLQTSVSRQHARKVTRKDALSSEEPPGLGFGEDVRSPRTGRP